MLVNANCFDYFGGIESGSVDLIFTDPPYLTALSELSDNLNGKKIDFRRLGSEFDRILKPSGQVAIFSDFYTATVITGCFWDWFKFRFFWIWRKPLGQPVNRKMPIIDTELIVVYSKRKSRIRNLTFNWQAIATDGEPYSKIYNGQNRTRKPMRSYVSRSDGKRYPKQILDYPAKCNLPESERTNHPTQKPVALCGYVIRALSNPGDLIFDPFAGSGSALIAAARLDRRFIGVEIDPEYYRDTRARLDIERNNLFAKGA